MGSKYFSKSNFFGFFKRFTENELPKRLESGKINCDNNKSIQIIDRITHPSGWKYYYKELQATVGKFVGRFGTRFNKMGNNARTTSGVSFQQAKQQIMQLVVDSKQRVTQLERELKRLRNMLPYRERANLNSSSSRRHSTFSMSMMEEGKIGQCKDDVRVLGDECAMPQSKELLSQYERDTTMAHEPRYKGQMASLKFPQNYSQRKSFTSNASLCTVALSNENDAYNFDSKKSSQASESGLPQDKMVQAKS